jgi:5-methylcytosine-specific restriction endonuclease McrA
MPTTVEVRRLVKSRDGHRCARCGAMKKLTVHHIHPISAGGSAMDPSNMETLCRKCHDEEHRMGVSPYVTKPSPQRPDGIVNKDAP